MTANELYAYAIDRVNAVRTDEDRFSSAFTKQIWLTNIAAARQIWVERNNGTLPSQWFLNQWMYKDDADQWDEFNEQEQGCILKFKLPNFINIKGVSTLSFAYPDGNPFPYIATTYAQYKGWVQHDFYKKKDLGWIDDGMLNLRVGVDFETLIARGVPYDAEEISTYNPMWDEFPASTDIIDMAMDKILKPMIYLAGKPIDTTSNSKDNNAPTR